MPDFVEVAVGAAVRSVTTPPAPPVSWVRQMAMVGSAAAGYGVAVQVGLWLKDPHHPIALFWPAAGVGASVVVLAARTSRRTVQLVVAAIAGANVLLNLLAGHAWPQVAAYTAANTVEAVLVGLAFVALSRRQPGPMHAMPSLVVAAVVGVGASTLVTLALLAPSLPLPPWHVTLNWAVPDLTGILVVGSILLSARSSPTGRRAEGVAQLATLLALCGWAFWFTVGVPIEWLPMVAVVWAAMRLGATWTAASSTLLAVAVAVGAGHGRGPFGAHPHRFGELLAGQAFSGFAVVTAMTLAAVVTERERAAKALAMLDPLTGLANRSMLTETAERILATNRPGSIVGLFYCDLDGFKQVNDSYGHAFGDLVLHSVAEQLRTSVRTGDLVARIGGDEFVILCPDLNHPSDTISITNRLGQVTTQTYSPDGDPVSVTVTVGHALADGPATLAELLRIADHRMYANKPHHRRRTDPQTTSQHE